MDDAIHPVVTLLDPRNDYVFKRIFANSPELLIPLINDIRQDEPDIVELEVLNPQIDPEELVGKYIVLDVLARDKTGSRYNVEMQVRRYAAWGARSAFYLSRMLSQQLNPGDDYGTLKPAIGIHLLDFDLFQEPWQQHQAFWCFEMRDRIQPEVILGNELQLNLIELRKADKLGLSSEGLRAWVTLFEHWKEESVMANIAYQPVKAALEKLKTLSADEEAQRLAFVRERALHDEASLLKDAREEGLAEGARQNQIKTLTRLLMRRFGAVPQDVAYKLDTASAEQLEQLEQWTDNILIAQTLEQVFQPDEGNAPLA